MHLDLSEMLSTTEVQRENNITRKANKQKQKSNKELIKIVLFIKKQTVTVTFTIPVTSYLSKCISQDYNIEKIERDDWVAVAYSSCDNCYIGQVEEKTQDNLRVSFLSKKKEFFYWPQIPDRDNVSPKFIVYPKVRVQCLGRKYKVAEEEKINRAFAGFSKKYF